MAMPFVAERPAAVKQPLVPIGRGRALGAGVGGALVCWECLGDDEQYIAGPVLLPGADRRCQRCRLPVGTS